MIDDYLEDGAELHRHTVEELAAWMKLLGMKAVDKHGERVSLETIAYVAELAESTRMLRERIAAFERQRDETERQLQEWIERTAAAEHNEDAYRRIHGPLPEPDRWQKSKAITAKGKPLQWGKTYTLGDIDQYQQLTVKEPEPEPEGMDAEEIADMMQGIQIKKLD